jgi:hypothetical protein
MNTTKRLMLFAVAALLGVSSAWGQAVEGKVTEEMGAPTLTYHGLVPGLSTLKEVREALGKPVFEASWYNYKLLYAADGRAGMVDTVHVDANDPESRLAGVEAASVPAGFENDAAIRVKLGEPEFALRMHTWGMLDYAEKGLRFSLDDKGNTTGVSYFPHGNRRVPQGERDLVDLTHLLSEPKGGPAPVLDGLEAAAGEVVISPQEQSWLPKPFSVAQDLKVRFVLLRKDGKTVALCGADLFGMGYQDVMQIRKGAKEFGLENLIFGMSHSHSAGDTIGVYGHYPAEYIGHIKMQTLAALKEAMERFEPVSEIRAASRELPMDGTRVMGLIRNARNPGILDPTMDVIQFLGKDKQPLATVVHFACHPESIEAGEEEIDADYPGYLCAALAKENVGQPIFLNGALGGMVSGDNKERTHESSKETGEKFAALALDVLKQAKPVGGEVFKVDVHRLELPLSNPRFEPLMEGTMREMSAGRVVTDMTYVQLGEIQIVTLPGEVLPEVSYEILEAMQGFPRILVGLGNDQLGYIIPAYDFRKGVYEESMSVGPATAYSVRDMALRMVRERR